MGATPVSFVTGGGYYHPSNGVGDMTGGWGVPRPNNRRHKGQDIRMPEGTPLIAVTSGVVRHYQNSSAGVVVYLDGADGNRYSYFHLSRRATPAGANVRAGTVIGYSGNTGNSSAPHLHFEFRPGGGPQVDPRDFLNLTRGLRVEPLPYGSNSVPTIDSPMQWWMTPDQLTGAMDAAFGAALPVDHNPLGTWYDQLVEYQLQQGAPKVESPTQSQARNLLHSTIQGMANMVRKSGYISKFPETVTDSPIEGEATVIGREA
jgi:hypothetical protein